MLELSVLKHYMWKAGVLTASRLDYLIFNCLRVLL